MIDYLLSKLGEVSKAFSLVRMSLPKMQITPQYEQATEMILLCGF